MQQITQILLRLPSDILTFLNSVPNEVYIVILASLPLSVLIAIVKTYVQRRWDKAPSEVKMFLINMGGIIMLAVGAYLEMTPTQDPATAILSIVGATALVQQPFFFRFVKPLINNLWKNYDKRKASYDELQSAAIPEEGLPIDLTK